MYLYVCPVAGGNVMCLKLCEVGHEHDGRPEASRQEDRDSAAKRKCPPEHRCQQCGRDLCPAHVCDGELHDEYTVRDLGSDVEEVEYEHERQQLCVEARLSSRITVSSSTLSNANFDLVTHSWQSVAKNMSATMKRKTAIRRYAKWILEM